MNLDDEICLCFHVTKRKVRNFIRVEGVRRPGQLSECFGAGTGCGWCRPFLKRILAEMLDDDVTQVDEPSPKTYATQRARYLRHRNGQPPENGPPPTK